MSTNEISSRKRGQDVSDDTQTDRNTSLMEKMMEAIQLEEKLNPQLTLKRFLSVRSAISTTSSFAERQQAAVGTRSQFRSLGAGTCGRVYEVPGTTDIFKVANYPGQETDQMWNDYRMHVKISEVFEKLGRDKLEVRVPRHRYFVGEKDSVWWSENQDRFPSQFLKAPSNLLCAERILPLAKPIRESLIDLYAPRNAIPQSFKTDPSNKDCLVRIYLGKRRERPNNNFFQLRNFNLHVDQMEQLQLDANQFAFAIAEALAIMHWACHLDGNDVEFVLGSSPKVIAQPHMIMPKPLTAKDISSMSANTSTWDSHLNDFKRRTTYIWMLDFNRCKNFANDTNDILQQLLHSFFRNDPYFPRPHPALSKDEFLWITFRKSYETASANCFKKGYSPAKHSDLPKEFMNLVEAEQRKRNEKKLQTQEEVASLVG
jgi:hypothetical protein